MSLAPSTTSSQPTPTGPAPLLCKLMLLPLLSSSHLPPGREAELLLLALLIGGSLAVAPRAGHPLQRGGAPCLAPLSSSIQPPATGAQLLVSARLHHSTPRQLHLPGTARARLGCSHPMRIPGARRTLLQGLQPRSSPLLLPGRPRVRLLPSIPPLGLLCCLLVAQLPMLSLHTLVRDSLGPCPMPRLQARAYLRSRAPCWSWIGCPWITWSSPTCAERENLLRNSEPRSRCMTA